MPNQVKNHSQANNSTLLVTGVSRNETSLLSLIESLDCRWVRLCFKRGKYQIELVIGKNNYHYASGKTIDETFQNLQERLQRFG